MDLVAWKSHIGLTKSGDGVLRATAKGWGRSGAITEAVITRSSAEEGFLIALPQPNVSLFMGVSNLSGSLYDSGRAHQETSSSRSASRRTARSRTRRARG